MFITILEILALNRPFSHSCKQRRQVEVRVDKIRWFVWNCPPEPRPHFFMFAHWSVMREKVYSYKKLLTIWEAISNTRHSFLIRYADTSKTFLIESAAPPPPSRCFCFCFLFFVCDEWASGSSFSKAEYHYPPDKSLSIGQVLEKTNCAFQWIDIYPVDSVIHLLSNWGQMKHSLSYLVLLQQIFLLYTNFLPTLRG